MSGRTGLAHDPALPDRDALLDETVVGDRLRTVLGLTDAGREAPARRVRAKYRPAQSLRVLHVIPAGDSDELVSTRMVPAERVARLADRAGATAQPREGRGIGRPRTVGLDVELGAVSWLFPHDRKIHTLDRLVRPGPATRRLLPGRWAGSELVAYMPEKAATAHWYGPDDESLCYAKVYADDAGLDGALRRAVALDAIDGTRARVPRVLAVVRRDKMLLLEALPGTRLDGVPPAQLGAGLTALGQALAALHMLPGRSLPAFGRLRPDRLLVAAHTVASARPDVATAANELARRLCERPPPAGSVLVHGDLHLKNVLLAGDRLSLLDLDQAGTGHPAADLGGLLAALRQARLAGRLAPHDERRLGAVLLAAYASAGGQVDEGELRWHVAAALLAERAVRAVNRVLPDALELLGEVLASAERLITSPVRAGAR